MAKVLCRNCEERKPDTEVVLVNRKVGGSYNRAPRWQACRICHECVRRLVERIGTGTMSTNRWSNGGLRRQAGRLPPAP